MISKQHQYDLTIKWTGNKGSGTSDYRAYDRDHVISAEGKSYISGSSDPAFRGNKANYNPEELFLASLSSCHMLWFLHLCADSGIIVTDYIDHPSGIMMENADGRGQFKEATLRPVVTVKEKTMLNKLDDLHKEANKFCFIANSVNFPVKHETTAKYIL